MSISVLRSCPCFNGKSRPLGFCSSAAIGSIVHHFFKYAALTQEYPMFFNRERVLTDHLVIQAEYAACQSSRTDYNFSNFTFHLMQCRFVILADDIIIIHSWSRGRVAKVGEKKKNGIEYHSLRTVVSWHLWY